MPLKRELKLEKYIDDASRKNEFQPLEDILQHENYCNVSHKCSKQFFSKLDTLICRELHNKDIKNVSTLLNVIEKFGNNISINGEDGLTSMIQQGLVQRMVTWFDKCKDILTCEGIAKDEDLVNLVEDFFDALMIVHDINDGKIEMLENFTLRTCCLISDPRMNVFIQQEAVRKLNVMLDTMPREARKKTLSTEEMLAVMNNMGKRILDAGDYDLQVAITEALCRMTTEKQRAELATQWFSMEFVTNAFKGIKDSDFETDCRKFLNQVNGMLGNKRRVFTFPCLSAFLEEFELQMPSDEKLEEFWIDFNIGSRSISFYVAADDNGEDHQWETVSILEDDVDTFSVEGMDMNSKTLLIIILKNPLKVGSKEGGKIALYFDSALNILEVTIKVYGANKRKVATKKQAISVAKTVVHIIFDESGSQILIPESQVSASSGKEKCASETEDKPIVERKLSSTTTDQKHNSVQEEKKTVEAKMITPSKRKMSEASMIIPSAGGFTIRSPLTASQTSTPRKGRVKPPLKMIHSAERTVISLPLETEKKTLQQERPEGNQVTKRKMHRSKVGAHREKHISAAEVAEMLQNEEKFKTYQKEGFDEKTDVVPDSQPVRRKDKSLLPGLMDGSFDEHRTYTKHTSLTSDGLTSSSVKQKTSISSGLTVQQGHAFSDRVFKQQAFYSIFEGKDSPKQVAKTQDQNVKTEQQLQETFEERKDTNNKTYTSKSVTKHSETNHIDKRLLKNTERKEFCSKSETSCQYLRQSRKVEKYGESSKKSALVIDDNATSSKKETRSRRTSHQKIVPELSSPSVEPRAMKAKSKELLAAAETLISTIGSRYSGKGSKKLARKSEKCFSMEKENSCANTSLFLASKKKGHNRSFSQLTTTINLNLTRGQLVNDIYSFNLSGTEEPTIKLGPSIHHGRKHLFSDTDTENRWDDSKTDISWLRESNRKEKPKLLGYSRQKTVKKPEALQKYTFPDTCVLKSEPKGKTKKNKVTGRSKPNAKADERTTDQTISKRPRRTTLKNNSYKDLSNSESESEEESEKQYPLRASKSETLHHNGFEKQKKSRKALDEPRKEASRMELKADSKQPAKTRKLVMPPVTSPARQISVEKMRSEEEYSETEYIQKHSTMARSTSSFLSYSSPGKSESPKNISVHSTKKCYATALKSYDKAIITSAENPLKKETPEKDMSSPDFSPLSLPPLTPTLDISVASGKDVTINMPEFVSEDTKDDPLDISNYLSGKERFESELKSQSASMLREESQPPSCVSTSSESRGKTWSEIPHSTIHMSGPTTRTTTANLKRMYNHDSESDVDENVNDEMEQEDEDDREETVHPKKLFKVAVHDQFTCRVSESLSTVSGNEISVIEGDSWEASSSDVGMMCQKISKEFTRKIQNRSRKIDYFNKQSLKSAQQHMTSMSFQIRECRINRLDEFQCSILEELENFEKDTESLKHLEKEFSNFLKQQTNTFSTYHKSEQRRIHHLKSSFEKNVFQSIDYEEKIFTSEMHLMREDMKLVQDRLLKEMQEEEIVNVRRGLQSLFMSGTRKF